MTGQDHENSTPTQLDRIEWKLDQILARMAGITPAFDALQPTRPTREWVKDAGKLPRMTPKQHVTLQMMMLGAGNQAIADVLGVTDNTAKVHVRTLAKKFGVRSRTEICLLAERLLREVDADTYKKLSGGLPKDWAERYAAMGEGDVDPWASVYLDEGEGDG